MESIAKILVDGPHHRYPSFNEVMERVIRVKGPRSVLGMALSVQRYSENYDEEGADAIQIYDTHITQVAFMAGDGFHKITCADGWGWHLVSWAASGCVLDIRRKALLNGLYTGLGISMDIDVSRDDEYEIYPYGPQTKLKRAYDHELYPGKTGGFVWNL